MKGPWVRANPMTQRTDYLYMQGEVSEVFERSWSMFKETRKASVQEKAPEQKEPKSKKSLKDTPTKEKKDGVKTFEDIVAESQMVKKTLVNCMARATNTIDNLNNSVTWSWAKGGGSTRRPSRARSRRSRTRPPRSSAGIG